MPLNSQTHQRLPQKNFKRLYQMVKTLDVRIASVKPEADEGTQGPHDGANAWG
jgi:hypothetical protein